MSHSMCEQSWSCYDLRVVCELFMLCVAVQHVCVHADVVVEVSACVCVFLVRVCVCVHVCVVLWVDVVWVCLCV